MWFQEELRTMPLIRLIIPFIIGIIVQIKLSIVVPFHLYIFLLSAVCLFIIYRIKTISTNYHYTWIFGILLYLILFVAGSECVIIKNFLNHSTNISDSSGLIIGKIYKPPIELDNSVKAEMEIVAVKNNKEWQSSSGRTMVYFEKDSLLKYLEYGDRIVFEPNLNDIRNMGNPNEFDYKQYLAFHLITKQAYLKSGKWKILDRDNSNFLKKISLTFRNKLLSIFTKYGLKGDEFAVTSALTLGYNDKLDQEIKHSYSSTGAMHVLSVSGLHVGIIYLMINPLLFFLNKKRHWRIVKAAVIILFLWFYAMLTGLSPAVLRAAAMFSFIIIGKTLSRNTNIYNILATSAFVLLLINPFFIMDIGFQLSYIAVLGIVFFQPKLYALFIPQNWLLDKIWALITVSIAAQLVTFPIGLYYFHQFPNYFLLTNILVIPVSSVLIYVAILLFFFSFITHIAAILGKILFYTVKILNLSVTFIEHLPFSVSDNISIGLLQVFIIYIFIITISLYLLHKKPLYMNISLVLTACFLTVHLYKSYTASAQKKFIVYNIKGISAYNFIDGCDNILLSNMTPLENQKKVNYYIRNNWLALGLKNEKFIQLDRLNSRYLCTNYMKLDNPNIFYKNNYINFHGKRIMILKDNNLRKWTDGLKINLDYIIITGNVKYSIAEILSYYNVKQIIIDSNNSRWRTDKWIEESKSSGIACYSVSEHGAFIADI
ncbi:MAG: ComEC/Rec2 family competence protein [Bacteroidia bacterium]|nr:ComEC/Rec2 family competence protein [Bacteroidia bacterium]